MQRGEVRLGNKVRDRVTGFKGIVTAITNWLNGCERILVQPQELGKEGKPKEAETFDTEQLEFISDGLAVPRKRTGGPCDDRRALRRA